MAGVAQLGRDRVRVAPVQRRLVSACKEVRAVGSQRDRGHGAHDFGLALDKHAGTRNLGNRAVASADQHVAVLQQRDDIDALLEEALGRPDALVELAHQVDLDDVACERA